MHFRHTHTWAFLFTVALGWWLAAADVSGAEDPKKGNGPVDKVRKGLEEVITIDLSEQTLSLAIKQLSEQTKLNIVVDRVAIGQMGYDPEQLQVSVKLKEAKVKSVLRSVLSPYNLSFVILGDTLLVSSDAVAMHRQMRQRVTVGVDKTELSAALKQLSKDTACNIMIDTRAAKEAKNAVSLEAEDIPLETAVRLLCEMAGLKPVRVGNVLFVTTKEIANELRNDPDIQNLGQVGLPGQPSQEIYLRSGAKLDGLGGSNVIIWTK